MAVTRLNAGHVSLFNVKQNEGPRTTFSFDTCQNTQYFFVQDARDDIGGAQNTGMLGILVKTGRQYNRNLLDIVFTFDK